MLPAPNPSKDAPQHIQDPLLGASTTLLTTPNPSQALITRIAPCPDTHDTIDKEHPYRIKGNTLTYEWANAISTPANVNPSENSIAKIQRSAHRKKIIISLPTSILKSRATLDFYAYEYFKGTSAYVPDPNIIHMSAQFIQFLQLLLDIDVFPSLLKKLSRVRTNASAIPSG